MSGHNPHGHLGQPINQSWNHLQVPAAFIPRQPQLAHMSNERPIRSPMSWPTPAHPAELYSYMAAAAAASASNHKSSPLDINPLLPAFVRSSAMPFGSVDLSLPSRNSLTPSPRSLASPSAASTPTLTHNNLINSCSESDENKLIRNNHPEAQPIIMNPSPVINDMHTAFFNSIVENSLNLNNSNASDSLQHGQNTEVLSLAPKETPKACPNNKPMELVKEQHNFKINSHESNTQINSTEPLLKSISQQPDQMFNAPLPGIPPNLTELSKSLLSIINNGTNSQMLLPSMLPMQANTPPLPINPSAPLNFLPQQSHIDNEQNSVSKSLSTKPITTNDDSMDSLIGLRNGDEQDLKKVRCRRRKPQKTIRMTNERSVSEMEAQLQNFSHNSDTRVDPKHTIDNENGLVNYAPSNHSQETVLNYNQATPQTQSMDLSNRCVVTDSHNTFRNGENFSELPLKLANNMRNDLNGFNENKMYARDFNSIGRTMDFPSSKFNPLNTDDLVKKVEEIVKCSNMNGTLDLHQADHQTNIEPPRMTQMKLNGKENGINLPPQSNIVASSPQNTHFEEIKCNGDNHHPSHTKGSEMNDVENVEHQKATPPAIEHENIRNAESLEDLPILPAAEAKIPEPLPMSNSTPKDDSSFEEIKANLHNIFADIEEDEKTTFEKTNSSMNSDINISEASKNEHELKDSERENESNTSTNSENQVKESEQKESTPSSNSDNKDSESSNDKHSKNGDEKMDNSSAAEPSNSMMPSSNGQNRPNKAKKTFKKKAAAKRNGVTNGKGKKKIVGGGESLKNGNKNGATGKSDKNGKVKEESSDNASKFRGPYIQIQKDGTEVVINAPITEEVAEKQSKIKNIFVKHHDRNKVRGLHVSTLSNKYDADTRDTTWMCVFCKLGPHKYGLGDLFGPFILSTAGEDFQLSQVDPKEDTFRSHRTKADMVRCKEVYVTPSKMAAVSNDQITSKKKRKISEVDSPMASTSHNLPSHKPDIFYGMTKSVNDSYEVWAHEDCVVWSSGVHIIGARIVGLEAAVWSSTRHKCAICTQYGAVLSCLNRTCTEEAHAPCAQRSQWLLDETNFRVRCNKHKTSDQED